MKKRLSFITAIAVVAMLCVLMAALVGCGGDTGNDNNEGGGNSVKISITLKNPLPVIEPYKEFDMNSTFFAEEGIDYSFEGEYSTDKEVTRSITFNGSKFTLSVDNAVFANITITGEKDGKSASKEISLGVEGKVDVVDNGYINLWKESEISNNACYNPDYIKEGNSSVKVSFSGYYNVAGTQFANLPGHLATVQGGIYDTEEFSIYKKADQAAAWEDAVMTFWIYYANAHKGHEDAKLDIGYRFAHCTTKTPQGIPQSDFDFQDLTECALGEWTQVAIRFKDLYKTTPLYLDIERWRIGWGSNDELMTFSDTINLKCRLYSEDYESREAKYIYTFYLDGVDIMTYADFAAAYPEFKFKNTSSGEEGYDYQGWANQFSIANWKTSGKGIAFDFTLANPEEYPEMDIIALFDGSGAEWKRISDMIGINFDEEIAEYGRLINLGNDKYRYELMFADVPLNTTAGEEATGHENANILYFTNYPTHLLVSNFTVIDSYSE